MTRMKLMSPHDAAQLEAELKSLGVREGKVSSPPSLTGMAPTAAASLTADSVISSPYGTTTVAQASVRAVLRTGFVDGTVLHVLSDERLRAEVVSALEWALRRAPSVEEVNHLKRKIRP